ncbi:MAG: hypothetical protein U1D55_04895 [Phycisphaerae bacterium]
MASTSPQSGCRSLARRCSFRVRAASNLLMYGACLVAGCSGADRDAPSPVESTFGRTGVGVLEFNYPRAAVAAPAGKFYVVDKAGHIQLLMQGGEFVLDWHMPEISAGKPTGLGISQDGRVFAADTHYSRVTVFSGDGRELQRFGEWGDGPGQFRLPTDVAVNARGEIYVSEYGGNDRVSKFTPDWRFLLSFGGRDAGDASMQRPQSLAIGADGSLWVADAVGHRICHFDAEGRFLGVFGKLGSGLGDLRFPYGVDLLSDGSLIVCEYGNNRVQRFDASGQSLGIWGRAGRKPGELAYPWAAVVGQGDRVLVIDSGNNRVQVFAGMSQKSWRK